MTTKNWMVLGGVVLGGAALLYLMRSALPTVTATVNPSAGYAGVGVLPSRSNASYDPSVGFQPPVGVLSSAYGPPQSGTVGAELGQIVDAAQTGANLFNQIKGLFQ